MARLPAATELRSEAERRAVETLPRFTGPAFRADSGFWHDAGTSAGDVVRFERDEYGNDIAVDPIVESVLDRVRAEAVVWACAERADAERYGEDIVEVALAGDTRVLVAEDGDAGMLLWLRPES